MNRTRVSREILWHIGIVLVIFLTIVLPLPGQATTQAPAPTKSAPGKAAPPSHPAPQQKPAQTPTRPPQQQSTGVKPPTSPGVWGKSVPQRGAADSSKSSSPKANPFDAGQKKQSTPTDQGQGSHGTGGPPPVAKKGDESSHPNGKSAPITKRVTLRDGSKGDVTRLGDGRVASWHVKHTDGSEIKVDHPLRGQRRVAVERNGRTIVAEGRDGYVQREYRVNGRTYYERTYVVGGRTYARIYRQYTYRGMRYYTYTPLAYYHPAFYAWASSPWVAPVYYSPAVWGWSGAPWYAYYGYAPYPAYDSAYAWLTDYLMAADLAAAYAAQATPPADPTPAATADQTSLSPAVKQMIADEVREQLTADQTPPPDSAPPTASADPVPDALNPAERVFVVSSALDVTSPDGNQSCSLTAGDVVMRISDTPDDKQNVNASVQSSKEADCATGQTVAVGVQDLQEMHNQFQEHLDGGLQKLAAAAGRNGLPAAPNTGTVAGSVPAPTPDADAAAQLKSAQREADQTEQAVQQSGS
jgi:hypothetical protein